MTEGSRPRLIDRWAEYMRQNDWNFEEAEDILYRAVIDRKIVSFNFMK